VKSVVIFVVILVFCSYCVEDLTIVEVAQLLKVTADTVDHRGVSSRPRCLSRAGRQGGAVCASGNR